MTWEETIKFIRKQPEFADLVRFAYFEEDLKLNVERFKVGNEFIETKKVIESVIKLNSSVKLLDIGSGNGITSIAFALEGVQVTSVEPDPSETIGAGAIRKLKDIYKLSNIAVHEAFAEELKFPDQSFDIVYSRQCMHHAHDLQQFLNECFRVLKKGGLLITARDHVIYDEKDKKWFLESHPLQHFYGGENAFTAVQYKSAMTNAGFIIQQELKHFDSVINYFPLDKIEKENRTQAHEDFVHSLIRKKTGILSNINIVNKLASHYIRSKLFLPYDEKKVPGRMYTFVAIK